MRTGSTRRSARRVCRSGARPRSQSSSSRAATSSTRPACSTGPRSARAVCLRAAHVKLHCACRHAQHPTRICACMCLIVLSHVLTPLCVLSRTGFPADDMHHAIAAVPITCPLCRAPVSGGAPTLRAGAVLVYRASLSGHARYCDRARSCFCYTCVVLRQRMVPRSGQPLQRPA